MIAMAQTTIALVALFTLLLPAATLRQGRAQPDWIALQDETSATFRRWSGSTRPIPLEEKSRRRST